MGSGFAATERCGAETAHSWETGRRRPCVHGSMENNTAPGWGAIDAALLRIYPQTEPLHMGTEHPWRLGGPHPLDGISFYPRTDPVPHWHVVGYGMTELYDKETDNSEESGWGFEFTFRAVRRGGDEEPPMWAAVLLQKLGRYVFDSGNRFEPGHTMKVGGPIDGSDNGSVIRALAFAEDPELGQIATPHGRVRFLQVIGLSLDEYEAALGGRAHVLLRVLGSRIPLGTTDMRRRSLLEDPKIAASLAQAMQH
ncbi:MAG: suppressor of fused domain protein [Nocardiopsaceae bacterium]|nr:suppressor of fused domain protein [Nocardiopsaceae bacterium]